MNSNELTPEMIQEVVDGYLGKLPESSQTPERKALRSSWAAQISQDAMRLYTSLNSQYHTSLEICQIMSEITGKEVDSTFRIFPPFYTDFGKNTVFGKHVFVNSCCHFQDQGGITIGDNALIGHNVVLATINHDLNPSQMRRNHYAPITIGNNVWIGSNAVILSGVTIGDWAAVAAGAVVSKDVEPYTVVGGIPARVIRKVDPDA